MTCVDQDKFKLADHGKSLNVALKELMKVPAIANGALGDIIQQIQWAILPIVADVTWVPLATTSAGSAAGFFEPDNSAPNLVGLKAVRITVMERKRSQVLHELVHALDMLYYSFNISHPPRSDRLAKRVPVLYLNPIGDIWKYGVMDVAFADNASLNSHEATLTFCKNIVRNNSLLKGWQRTMLMTQLDYAARADKLHVEFSANVAQCLALIYQWGFTGAETGLMGKPRSLTLVIRRMEQALQAVMNDWRQYVAPARKRGAIIQFKTADKRIPDADDAKHYFESDEWWKKVDAPLGF